METTLNVSDIISIINMVISIGIIKNPLIIASCLGILTLLLKIKIPTAIEKTISDVSKIATPL